MVSYKEKSIFKDAYKGKKVLVTGDTGFKGAWLSIWLNLLGAKVMGYSSYLPSKPCLFSVCKVNRHIKHIAGDIRNYDSFKNAFLKYKPDIVFHLAAQPLVSESYLNPKLTFETNILGTINVLECMRKFSKDTIAIIITSDKCYRNMEWTWGYRETDLLGGDDPYASSKACAELVFHSYYKSFFYKSNKNCRIATTRAGNVIGGGDWAVNRIVPDCVRAWSKNKILYVRNPKATRPWQHVLEPLSGYLWLGAELSSLGKLSGESFNFGPNYKANESVETLIRLFSKNFTGKNKWRRSKNNIISKESLFLKVSCDKAMKYLDWNAVLSFSDTIKMAAQWYVEYYKKENRDMLGFTISQIEHYIAEARKNNLSWAKGKS